MADTLSTEERSRLMSRIRGKYTKPELVVRRLLHAMGYSFRLHRRDLPGNPDIVLPRHGVCIFVHGCFWHLHSKCKDARIPKTRTAWWRKKLEGNATRDKRHAAALRRLGWRVITIWEYQTKNLDLINSQLQKNFFIPLRFQQRFQRFVWQGTGGQRFRLVCIARFLAPQRSSYLERFEVGRPL